MLSYAHWYLALGKMRVGARKQATAMLIQGIDDFSPRVQLTTSDTTVAQMVGLMRGAAGERAAPRGD